MSAMPSVTMSRVKSVPRKMVSEHSAPGKARAKVVTIEITRKGRLNLHKFDAALQSQLEGYLVALGILSKGQTLNPQDMATSDTSNLQPAYED
jgi:hypothetical protein